jgi:regulator of cell morphogenesis and NO signaling
MLIADIVRADPRAAKVFEKRHIEFCCDEESMTLGEACQRTGLAATDLLRDLELACSETDRRIQWDLHTLDPCDLVECIIDRYYRPLSQTLGEIVPVVHKLSIVHGRRNRKLFALEGAVRTLWARLDGHMSRAELHTFPALLASNVTARAQLLQDLYVEHCILNGLLLCIRAQSDDFTAPSWACLGYRTALIELSKLESFVHDLLLLESHALRRWQRGPAPRARVT